MTQCDDEPEGEGRKKEQNKQNKNMKEELQTKIEWNTKIYN